MTIEPRLTPRQQREVEYHRQYAAKLGAAVDEPVALGVVRDRRRRWWNAYWSTYTLLQKFDLKGKRVLVPGCGMGDDAIRIACLGADVSTFDLSPEMVGIAKHRVQKLPNPAKIQISLMAAESLEYRNNSFDIIFLIDILHHIDITNAANELRRVAKPQGRIIGDELYTHSILQQIRESRLICNTIYPMMQRFVYECDDPYITDDEHKINEIELRTIFESFPNEWRISYFNFILGRLLPVASGRFVSQLDRIALMTSGPLGQYLAGRILFTGVVQK